MLFEVARVDVFGRDAVVDEFPYILSEAATEVKKGVLGVRLFEEREDAGVRWLDGDGEVKKSEPADARVG